MTTDDPEPIEAPVAPPDPTPEPESPASTPGPAIAGWQAPDSERPITGWQAPEVPPPRPTNRLAMLAAWIVGGVLMAIAARLSMANVTGSDAYRAGAAVGSVLVVLAITALALWALSRAGATRSGVLRSPWLPLGGGLLAFAFVVLRVVGGGPPPPVDAATGLHIGAPYALVETDTAVADQILDAFGRSLQRSSAVRTIEGPDGSRSILVVVDAAMRSTDFDEFVKGIGDNVGSEPIIETIAGRSVVTAEIKDGHMAAWFDEPLVFALIAADRPTLLAEAEAVIKTEPVLP